MYKEHCFHLWYNLISRKAFFLRNLASTNLNFDNFQRHENKQKNIKENLSLFFFFFLLFLYIFSLYFIFLLVLLVLFGQCKFFINLLSKAMVVCSRISLQSLTMMLSTCPGLTKVVCFITQLEAFRLPKGELWAFDRNLYRGLVVCWELVICDHSCDRLFDDASCCLAGAVGFIS